jgi:hypothetical protein
MGHDPRQPNQLYLFPTELTLKISPDFPRDPTARRLAAELKRRTAGERVVYSAYGSPYACSLEGLKVKNVDDNARVAVLSFTGRAVRRRDIPTLAQRRQTVRSGGARGAGDDDVDEAEVARHLRGFRVIKSRFGTSKCGVCGEAIDPGVKIARQEPATRRGGWAHLRCAVGQRRAAAVAAAEGLMRNVET